LNPSYALERGLSFAQAPRWPLALVILALAACEMPTFKGPQIQEPPRGFYKQPDAGQNRRMFLAREVVHHDAWVNAAWGDISTIHINGYPGTLMRADVQDALEDAKAAITDSTTFSDVQEMTIDGRKAWGWAERFYTHEKGLAWIAYRVAIPYDTITYTVELFSWDPALKSNPDTLLVIAATFAIGEAFWNIPLIIGIVVVLIFLISMVRKRGREKALRHQSITLKRVEREEEEGGPEKEAASQPLGRPEKRETGNPPERDPKIP